MLMMWLWIATALTQHALYILVCDDNANLPRIPHEYCATPDCPQKSKVLPGTRHSATCQPRSTLRLGTSSGRDHLSLPVDSQFANEISSVPEHTDPLHRWRIQGVTAYRTIAPSHADTPDDSTSFSNLSADTKAKEARIGPTHVRGNPTGDAGPGNAKLHKRALFPSRLTSFSSQAHRVWTDLSPPFLHVAAKSLIIVLLSRKEVLSFAFSRAALYTIERHTCGNSCHNISDTNVNRTGFQLPIHGDTEAPRNVDLQLRRRRYNHEHASTIITL